MPAAAALPSGADTRGECEMKSEEGREGSGMDVARDGRCHFHHPCSCWYDTGCPLGGLAGFEEGGLGSFAGSLRVAGVLVV